MKYSILLILACLFSQTAWAGWVVTYKDAESGEKSQEFYESGKANLGALKYTGKHFLVVDNDSKAYWKGTTEQYCKALGAQREMMETQMASLPAQYRPVPISKKKVTRKKIGTKSIAGYSATGYEFYVNGNQGGRIWVSSDSDFSDIINFEKSMLKKMKCFEGMSSASLEGADLYKETVANAFILKESYRQVVSIKKTSVSSTNFNAPGGYKSFSDYQKFMDHISGSSRSTSNVPSRQSVPSFDPTQERSQPTTSKSKPENQEDNVIVKDAKDITDGAVDEAHQSTKRGIQDEVSKDIKKEVKGFLDKLF